MFCGFSSGMNQIKNAIHIREETPAFVSQLYEPVREKTNNVGSDQVQHKPGCTVTDG